MTIPLFKATAAVVLLLIAVGGGWIAVKLCSSRRCARLLSLSNALAGGFFLGAGLLHLLPDAHESLAVLRSPFPWAMVLCLAGFLLILFLEKVVMAGHAAIASSAGGSSRAAIYPYVLTVVLSLHSFIAGYALGAGATFNLALVIFVAEGSHKLSAAFALGVSLVRTGMARIRVLRIMLLFALMTPLGIIPGVLVSSRITGDTATIVSGIIDALTAGTFLYVAIVDILGEEFEAREDRWAKFALLLCGLGLMGLLAIWV